MILSIVNITGTDGLARQWATMGWNQNVPGQDTKANTIAADAVAVAPCVFVVNTFLIEHKDLFILHSQYHGGKWPYNVIHFAVSVSGSDIETANIYSCFEMNPAQQEMWIAFCLAYKSFQQTILVKVFF